jgi:archaellum component FlaG (FlaF/FlaG flagellin family)
MSLNVQGFTFSPVELNASLAGKEDLTLNLIRGNEDVEAVKIRFRLSIRTSPLSASVNYEAFAWLAKNIGVVKWQGNGTIINVFTGGGIVFADTSSTVTQNLVEYDVN